MQEGVKKPVNWEKLAITINIHCKSQNVCRISIKVAAYGSRCDMSEKQQNLKNMAKAPPYVRLSRRMPDKNQVKITKTFFILKVLEVHQQKAVQHIYELQKIMNKETTLNVHYF